MNQYSDDLKKTMQENSKKLTQLGSILAKKQFSYKIEEKTSKEYWQKRIEDLTKYINHMMKMLIKNIMLN